MKGRMLKKTIDVLIPPFPKICTYDTCKVPGLCMLKLGSLECIESRKKYYRKSKKHIKLLQEVGN